MARPGPERPGHGRDPRSHRPAERTQSHLGENILIHTDAGELFLIAADPSDCRELGRAKACGPNWCNPAYADGRLYLRDGLKATSNLYCLELCARE